jgi:hypothetical protein
MILKIFSLACPFKAKIPEGAVIFLSRVAGIEFRLIIDCPGQDSRNINKSSFDR